MSDPVATESTVREAGAGDVEAVATAVEALLVELGGRCPERPVLETEVRALLDDPAGGSVLIAEADGEIVGLLSASWQRAIHVPGVYATIQDLWVDEAWRSRGVGAELVEAIASQARTRGVSGWRSVSRARPSRRSLRPSPSTSATGSSTSGRGCGGSCRELRAVDDRAAAGERRRRLLGAGRGTADRRPGLQPAPGRAAGRARPPLRRPPGRRRRGRRGGASETLGGPARVRVPAGAGRADLAGAGGDAATSPRPASSPTSPSTRRSSPRPWRGSGPRSPPPSGCWTAPASPTPSVARPATTPGPPSTPATAT